MSDVKSKVQLDWKNALNSGKTISKAELARKYGVSERTIRRYLEGVSNDKPTPKATATKPKKVSHTAKALSELNSNTSFAPTAAPAKEEAEYRILATSKSISITKLVNSKAVDTVVADTTNPSYQTVFDGIRKSGMSQEYLAEAFLLLQPKQALKVFSQGKLTVDAEKNEISYTNSLGKKSVVNNSLANRIMNAMKSGETEQDIKKLVGFLDVLVQNPSYRVVNDLWNFLKHNDIEITDDGCFIGWKVVRSDYLDKHTGTMSNAPGTVVEMPRNEVNENPNDTCSAGLHVCAKSYISSFRSNGDRIVRVKVSAMDAVSVPTDYNGAKLRTCRYTVLDDVTNKF